MLQQGELLQRLGGLRVLRIGGQCFINSEVIDTDHLPAVDALCHNFSVDAALLGEAVDDPSFMALLAMLVNSGYWYFTH